MARKKTPKVRLTIRSALSRRLREIRQELFGDHGGPELARRLNLPARTWYNYETGVTVPAEILLAFIELTGASPSYLVSGEGSRYAVAEERPMAELSSIELIRRGLEKLERERATNHSAGIEERLPACRENGEFLAVPVFSPETLNGSALDPADAEGRVMAFRQWLPNPAATIAVRVADDAMNPMLPRGSIAAIDRSDTDPADLQGKIVAARHEGELMIRWLDGGGRHLILRPNQPDRAHPLVPIEIDAASPGFLVGRVVWSWSRFDEA